MIELELFYERIPEEARSASSLIPYFVYFCSGENNEVTPKQVEKCFNDLLLKPYSNIPYFLTLKSKGQKAIFLKNKCSYKLTRVSKEEIAKKLKENIHIPISEKLFPMSILDNTPYYVVHIAKQMCKCYEAGLYDASLVMMRKLLETLIIECFERHGIDAEIKNISGYFIYLSDLIPAFINSNKWNASRNFVTNIKKIKDKADSSAHNRKFMAKDFDLDDCKFELRQIVEEIVLTIDYQTWNKK